MKNIHRLFAAFIPAFIFIFSFSVQAHAIYLASGDVLNLPKEKKIDETAMVAANNLVVDADINGDLLCAGKDVTINGNIKGDVLCAAQSLRVNGSVDGNVRVISQSTEINGNVSRNVYDLSQTLTIAKFTVIKGDIIFGVQNVDLRGVLGRDMLGAAEQLTISGSLLRNAKVAGTKINLIDPAKIGGNFEYFIDSAGLASVNQKNIKGEIIRHEIVRAETQEKDFKQFSKAAMITGKIFWLISTFILGFALIYFLRQGVLDRTRTITHKPFATGLIGFATLILTPIAICLLLISFIGIPLAIVLLLEYIMSIIIATIYPTIIVGGWIILKLSKRKYSGYGWPLVAGTLAFGLILLIPVIGPIVGFIFLCLGLGATLLSYLPQEKTK